MEKVFVKYNTKTMEVDGFLLEEQLQPNFNYIEITKDYENELRQMCDENCGTLFVVDVKNKKFESKVISIESNLTYHNEINLLKNKIKDLEMQINNK